MAMYRDSVGNTYSSMPKAPPSHTAKSTKHGRKYNRNRVKCAAYRVAGTREKNKARRIARDVRRATRSPVEARRAAA